MAHEMQMKELKAKTQKDLETKYSLVGPPISHAFDKAEEEDSFEEHDAPEMRPDHQLTQLKSVLEFKENKWQQVSPEEQGKTARGEKDSPSVSQPDIEIMDLSKDLSKLVDPDPVEDLKQNADSPLFQLLNPKRDSIEEATGLER